MPPQAPEAARTLARIRARIAAACRPGIDPGAALLAVSKLQPAAAIRALAAAGQVRFGENYVQEAIAKQRELDDLALEWHLIGPLQSNKCALAAGHFDWVHSVDRAKLVPLLARARDPVHPPLNVLLQVNVDDEASKAGCAPGDLGALADAVVAQPTLRLRGLMAIPAPFPEQERRRDAFRRMRGWFDSLRTRYPHVDTLSMGMSEDFELALAEGATLVRIGSALFGARPAPVRKPSSGTAP
jgi:pyridoxal phosphate enzyme (YggS family)